MGQVLPQAPQLPESDARSTQEPPQAVSPPVQPFAQPVGPHTSPTAHTVLQLPQCLGSLFSSTHSPLHAEYPPSHVMSHTEAVQSAEP